MSFTTTMPGTTHPCAWPGCDQRIPTEDFACPEHWDRLPRQDRLALASSYRTRVDAARAYADAREYHETLKERVVARLLKEAYGDATR